MCLVIIAPHNLMNIWNILLSFHCWTPKLIPKSWVSLLSTDELRRYLNYKAKKQWKIQKISSGMMWFEYKEGYKWDKVTWTFKFVTLAKIQEHFRSLRDSGNGPDYFQIPFSIEILFSCSILNWLNSNKINGTAVILKLCGFFP